MSPPASLRSASRPECALSVGPERKSGEERPARGDDADCRVHALAALVRPVHVFQVQQQGQFVDHQCVCRAVGDRHGRVAPPLLCPAQAYRSDRGEQCDADVVVVKVSATDADASAFGAVPGTDPVG